LVAGAKAATIYGESICAGVIDYVYDDVLDDYLSSITSSVSAEAYANIDTTKIRGIVADEVYDEYRFEIRDDAANLVAASS